MSPASVTSFDLSELRLPVSIMMPPMTHARAAAGYVHRMMAGDYSQRSLAGLIITGARRSVPKGRIILIWIADRLTVQTLFCSSAGCSTS